MSLARRVRMHVFGRSLSVRQGRRRISSVGTKGAGGTALPCAQILAARTYRTRVSGQADCAAHGQEKEPAFLGKQKKRIGQDSTKLALSCAQVVQVLSRDRLQRHIPGVCVQRGHIQGCAAAQRQGWPVSCAQERSSSSLALLPIFHTPPAMSIRFVRSWRGKTPFWTEEATRMQAGCGSGSAKDKRRVSLTKFVKMVVPAPQPLQGGMSGLQSTGICFFPKKSLAGPRALEDARPRPKFRSGTRKALNRSWKL